MPLFNVSLIERDPLNKETGRFETTTILASDSERAKVKAILASALAQGLTRDCELQVEVRPF